MDENNLNHLRKTHIKSVLLGVGPLGEPLRKNKLLFLWFKKLNRTSWITRKINKKNSLLCSVMVNTENGYTNHGISEYFFYPF